MGLDTTRPDDVDQDIRGLFNLISQSKSADMDEVREALKRIKQVIGNDPDLIKAEGLIRRKELIGK